MAGDLHYLELTELAACIKTGDVSPVAVTRAVLDRIAAIDGTLRSYATVMPESAMADAQAAEAEIAAGLYRGPLHGVPIAVKDLFWTKGVATAAGMPIHKDYRPAEDATVVRGCGKPAPCCSASCNSPRAPIPTIIRRCAAAEPVERRLLAWHLVQRPGRRDGRRPVLRRRSPPTPADRSAGRAPPTG